MGDIIVIFFFQNVIIFSCIFWALMVLGSYFYKQKTHESKRQFYECGFKSLGDINFQINLNFLMLCVFLVLYDIEFTLIYPFLFNIDVSNIFNVLVLFIFMLLIIVSLIYDWQLNSLNWQY